MDYITNFRFVIYSRKSLIRLAITLHCNNIYSCKSCFWSSWWLSLGNAASWASTSSMTLQRLDFGKCDTQTASTNYLWRYGGSKCLWFKLHLINIYKSSYCPWCTLELSEKMSRSVSSKFRALNSETFYANGVHDDWILEPRLTSLFGGNIFVIERRSPFRGKATLGSTWRMIWLIMPSTLFSIFDELGWNETEMFWGLKNKTQFFSLSRI